MNAANRILAGTPDRFRRQIEFILEIDRLKEVYRQSHILYADRHENSAEHSWHLAIAALLLSEYANQPVDTSRVIRMGLFPCFLKIRARGDLFFSPFVVLL